MEIHVAAKACFDRSLGFRGEKESGNFRGLDMRFRMDQYPAMNTGIHLLVRVYSPPRLDK